MTSHGIRMVETARRVREIRSAIFSGRATDVEDAEASPATVTLSPSVAGIKRLPDWNDVALTQGKVEADALRQAKNGQYFALQDRNSFAESWRPVFIVRDKDAFVLFDRNGVLLREASAGVPEGRHQVDMLLEEFTDVDMQYYRTPELRRVSTPPRPRNVNVSEVEAVETCHQSEHTVDGVNASDVEPASPCAIQSVAAGSPRAGEAQPAAERAVVEPAAEPAAEPTEAADAPAAASEVDTTMEVGDRAAASDAEDDETGSRETAGQPANGGEEGEVALTMLSTGSRVRICEPTGDVGGMVASRSGVSMVVALDNGTWKTHLIEDLGSKILADTSSPSKNVSGVAALAFNHSNTNVLGMLLGIDEDDIVLGGKVNAYCSHIARPLQTDQYDTRLKGREATRPETLSFSLGDHVQQLGNPSMPTRAVAAVVRVLYSRRGAAQARRMLVLVELNNEMKLSFSEANPPLFFPASWNNWARLEKESTLDVDDINRLNEAYKKATRNNLVSMTSVSAAVKFAGANLTPSQNATAPRPSAPPTNKKPTKRTADKESTGNTPTDPIDFTSTNLRIRIPLHGAEAPSVADGRNSSLEDEHDLFFDSGDIISLTDEFNVDLPNTCGASGVSTQSTLFAAAPSFPPPPAQSPQIDMSSRNVHTPNAQCPAPRTPLPGMSTFTPNAPTAPTAPTARPPQSPILDASIPPFSLFSGAQQPHITPRPVYSGGVVQPPPMTPQQWCAPQWYGGAVPPPPLPHWCGGMWPSHAMSGGGQRVSQVEIGMRRELAGLKAAQNIEPTAVRAEMIARLEVELHYMY